MIQNSKLKIYPVKYREAVILPLAKLFNRVKNSQGVTLIEIIIVIFVTTLFSLIIISNFPKIQRQFALSRVTYKLAQDLRKTQDLGLSGVPINDKNTDPIITKGYGIYIDPLNPKEYVIYADVSSDPTNPLAVSDQKYSGDPYVRCDGIDQDAHGICKTDCVIDIIDLSKENSSLSIKEIRDVKNNILITFPISINFMPPDPIIKITDNKEPPNFYPTVKIVFKNTDGSERTVLANTSGLINVQTN